MLTLKESIRPSADLRNHYNDISKQCKENKEAVIITVNGRGDTVALSYEEYKNMKARIELLEILAEAEDDIKNIDSYMIKEREAKEKEIKEKIYNDECEKIDKMVSNKIITKEKGEKLKVEVKENLQQMKRHMKRNNK